MTNEATKFKTLAVAAARAADAKKAEEVTVYDLSKISSVVYYVLIVNSVSSTHMSALSEEIKKELRKKKTFLNHKEGENSKSWRVLDFGGLMVHVFEPETRMFYDLDKIYHQAGKVNWKLSKRTKKTSNDIKTRKKVKR